MIAEMELYSSSRGGFARRASRGIYRIAEKAGMCRKAGQSDFILGRLDGSGCPQLRVIHPAFRDNHRMVPL